MNVLKETSSESRCTKTCALSQMAEGRFASLSSVEEFILETKNEHEKIEDIPAVELNEYISQFIISVCTKDGNEYEQTSLRSLVASFERHLKKKGYSASIINDLVFEKTRNVLQSNKKQLKKQGKGNKAKASVALSREELRILGCRVQNIINFGSFNYQNT